MSPTATSPELSVRIFHDRQARLREALQRDDLDGLIVSFETDIRYLSSFIGHDSLMLVDGEGAAIISDFRYDEELQPVRDREVADVIIGTRHRLQESVQALCGSRSIRRLGFQAEHLTVAARDALAEALPDIELAPTNKLVGSLRICKDEQEIEAIERAVIVAQDALSRALRELSPGMTERELCARFEYEMKRLGAEGPSFAPIVAVGPHGSLPHYGTGDTVINEGCSLLIDWGAHVNGYNSDLTRTFGIGTMPSKIAEIYDIVLEAQQAAIDACRPGVSCASIDAVARDIITDAGYGDQFGHGLGHGMGMLVHEDPYFNHLSTDTMLQPGMVMTVEPGIYLPGVGGVRIEDDVVITADGCRVLSSFPKDAQSMVLAR